MGGSGRSGSRRCEDKILQRAVVEVLNAIYEPDFLGFSYGFRPGRSPHDALDALATAITRRRVNWVLDADFRDYFSSLDHRWLERFVEHRIADRRILRLIQEVVERRGNRGRVVDGVRGGRSAGGFGITAPGERLPARVSSKESGAM